MADVFTKAKRSAVMARIRGRGNKDTELALAKLLRANGIIGWRRQVEIRGRDVALRRHRPVQGRNTSARVATLHASRWARRANPTKPFRVRPDFVFGKSRTAVFVDGCFWHGCPEHGTKPRNNAAFWQKKLGANKRRDAQVTRILRRAGWRVLRVWEHELKRGESSRVIHRIQRALGKVGC